MTTTGPQDVLSEGRPVGAATPDTDATRGSGTAPTPLPDPRGDSPPGGPNEPAPLPPVLRMATRGVPVLLVCVALLHLFLLFLHVAPENQISRRYSGQVQNWVFPLFEQNWRLFAPDPESAIPQISVRTARTAADGHYQVSDWFDLTAVDDAGVRHNPFPSHTTQNMLRRAWTGYLESHSTSDVSYTDRAKMWQEYLRNIAVDRAAMRSGAIEWVQLRVRTSPVPNYDAAGHTHPLPPSAVDTRKLPWWKVTTHAH